MNPVLRSGDFIQVTPRRNFAYTVKNTGILVLLLPGYTESPVVHRLVCIDHNHLFEKGDSSKSIHLVYRENIIGEVTHRKRSGKISKLRIPLKWRVLRLLSTILEAW